MEKKIYDAYTEILKEELVPAMGCTEPIAIAYAAALARETLGLLPEKVTISASGNIIKNVKSVVVPNTGGLRGIAAAAAAGERLLSWRRGKYLSDHGAGAGAYFDSQYPGS
jgi:L-cysteine desulfidase